MKKPRKTVAEKTAAFAFAFDKHPHQDELLASAIELRSIALRQAANGSTPQAFEAQAKAEFNEALQAIIYPPSEKQFYCLWARHLEAPYLAACIDEVWSSGGGRYGALPVQHWFAKK